MRESDLVNPSRIGRIRENPDVLENPFGNESKSCKSNKEIAGLEDLRFNRNREVVSTGTVERTHKYIRQSTDKHPSQGPETVPGTSNQRQMRRFNPPKEKGGRGTRVQSGRDRETRTTGSKGHIAAEGRPDWSRKTTTVRPCPYYLRSRFKEPEGLPEEQRSTGIDSLPQNSLRRRIFSMEALDGDPADRST
ncbi:uncharacterized protein TNCV_3224901 [Trichonephila clavipes]|nr:uncharacterized protein TNCV_3224901 [Trichonephila clavipes]